jgi:predicted site-specific integrase-resolvase
MKIGYARISTKDQNLELQKGVSSRKVKKTGLRIKSIMNYSFDSFYKLFILNGLNSPCLNVTLLFQT